MESKIYRDEVDCIEKKVLDDGRLLRVMKRPIDDYDENPDHKLTLMVYEPGSSVGLKFAPDLDGELGDSVIKAIYERINTREAFHDQEREARMIREELNNTLKH